MSAIAEFICQFRAASHRCFAQVGALSDRRRDGTSQLPPSVVAVIDHPEAPQTGPILGFKDVGDDSFVAHAPSDLRSGTVKLAASVRSAVSANTGHFECHAIVQPPRYGSSRDRHATKLITAPFNNPDGKFAALRGSMMSMPSIDELTGGSVCDRPDLQTGTVLPVGIHPLVVLESGANPFRRSLRVLSEAVDLVVDDDGDPWF